MTPPDAAKAFQVSTVDAIFSPVLDQSKATFKKPAATNFYGFFFYTFNF